MKSLLKFATCILITGVLFFLSCQKEYSCENCSSTNKPPIANAGADQTITLPKDSIVLDGSLSSDQDGTIISHHWTKISGPVSANIIKTDSSKTLVKALLMGIYKFELKVTDNGGLSAKDTVQITVNDPAQPNRPPVANTGADQTITLPVNTVNLNGSGSADPDNNITGYYWTKISGPSSFNIANANAVHTPVTNLIQGVYQFELKVTDGGGLFAKDTVQISVNAVIVVQACDSRPIINATLVQIGTLSDAGIGLVSAAAGNKILFAGGQRTITGYSTRVDIYDITTNTWSAAELTHGDRMGMAAATVGNKVLFAGGMENDNGTQTSRVDIYDATTNSWSQAELSKARAHLAAATLGDKVFFAGGGSWEPFFMGSNVVDIYDNSANTWTTATLSQGRSYLTATTIGNKIYFAGGAQGPGYAGNISTRIDIYDGTNNSWHTTEMQEGKSNMAGIAFNEKILWASGWKPGGAISDQVEIKNVNTGASYFTCVIPRTDFSAVIKGDNIIFFTGYEDNLAFGGTRFEIYNITTNTWSTGKLNQRLIAATIISLNNTIYVAGGTDDPFTGITFNQVWKLEF